MRFLIGFCLVLAIEPSNTLLAQGTKDKSNDATQTILSPLGLGTGATVALTQNGTTVSVAVSQQFEGKVLNFWQLGMSGTLDKQGQAQVFSSQDSDAPGFQGKVGLGYSSFYAKDTSTDADDVAKQQTQFRGEAWCMDTLAALNKTLPKPGELPKDSTCAATLTKMQSILADQPATMTQPAKDTAKLIVDTLSGLSEKYGALERSGACTTFKDKAPVVYQFCPASGKPQSSIEEQKKIYPNAYKQDVKKELSPFYFTVAGNWIPSVTSVEYRAVTAGVADLATKHEFHRLLEGGSFDFATYYERLSWGADVAYGEAVKVKLQHVCQTTTSGTYTAQDCSDVMVGAPNPKRTKSITSAIAVNPLVPLSFPLLFRPGTQVTYHFEQRSDGHSTTLKWPIYFAGLSSPMKLVFGFEPTWNWDTDPKSRKKFSVSLFAGARPGVLN